MYVTTPDARWERLRVPTARYANLAELNGLLFASSDSGMVQVRPPKARIVGPKLALDRVVSVGDGLIAPGKGASLVYDGRTWKEIDVPSCEARGVRGGKPDRPSPPPRAASARKGLTKPSLDALLAHLAGGPTLCKPGLSARELKAFESALKATLPEPVRALYGRCGGMDSDTWDPGQLPMRLMTMDEVAKDDVILRDSAEIYRPHPSPDVRYLFTDDGSNWAGVFVTGPLSGKWCVLNHGDSSTAPLFRGFESFVEALLDAAERDADWTEMRADYPAHIVTTPELARSDLQLANLYFERFRTARNMEEANEAVETALFLLPATEFETLCSYIVPNGPDVSRFYVRDDWARWIAIRIATRRRQKALVPALVACASGANFTLWEALLRALVACGAMKEAKRVWGGGQPSWRSSRREP